VKLDAQKLAKEIFDAFTLRLSKALGKEAPTWGSLSGNERGAFRDAVEEVVLRQIEILALDVKLDEMMSDVLEPKVVKKRVIALGPGPVCYYCGQEPVLQSNACVRCLRSG
jgi:hypothetical protein